MEINDLYDLIHKEAGSNIIAATIIVRDQNQCDMRAYSMNKYGNLECYDLDKVLE